nr:type II toxin-antitoxin system PemK/MazF family toxin [Xanthomonas citri]
MERGDIYLVSLDPTSGHEQQGTRPVLIVSPGPFNRLTKTPVVLPITTGGNFARTAGFTVSLTGEAPKRPESCAAINRAPWTLDRVTAASWKASQQRSPMR